MLCRSIELDDSEIDFPFELLYFVFLKAPQLLAVLVTLLFVEMEYPELKRGKVYFDLQFVEVSVHNWLAPRQRVMAEEQQFMAGRSQQSSKQQAMSGKQQAITAALFLSLMFYSGYTPLGQVVLTSCVGLAIIHTQNCAKSITGLIW